MSLIPPVVALIGWTFVMWVWLYATRNVILVRFSVFAAASLVLLLLLLRTVYLLS